MIPLNKKLHDEFIKRGVAFTRVEAGLANDAAAVLTNLSNELSSQLIAADFDKGTTARKLARLTSLQSRANDAIVSHYDELDTRTAESGLEIAQAEALWLGDTINSAIGVEFLNANISSELLKSITSNSMIDGAVSSAWWGKQEAELQFQFMAKMRQGILQGEGLNDLLRRVRGTRENKFTDGIIPLNQAQTLVRTAALTVANDTRLAIYKQNKDIIKGYQWHATLDPRTCTVCGPKDGMFWTFNGKGDLPFVNPPAHFRCRCVLLPITYSWEELANRSGGDTDLAKKMDKISPATRSSMDGQVVASTTWGDWLKGKAETDPLMVKDILGKERFDLWQAGKIAVNDLIDDKGRVLRVSELSKNISD